MNNVQGTPSPAGGGGEDLENFSKTRPQNLVSFYYLFFFNDAIILQNSSFKLDHSSWFEPTSLKSSLHSFSFKVLPLRQVENQLARGKFLLVLDVQYYKPKCLPPPSSRGVQNGQPVFVSVCPPCFCVCSSPPCSCVHFCLRAKRAI